MNFLRSLFLFIIIAVFNIYGQENFIVRDIKIEGNKTISDSELLNQITHFATGWFSDVILFEDPFLFSSEIFDRDKLRIIDHYQRNGFLNAQIGKVNLNSDHEGKTLEIEIEIIENIPVKVNETDFKVTGAEKLSFLTNLKDVLSLKNDVRFTEDLLKKDKNTINDSLYNNGYPYASIDFDLNLDTLTNKINIQWIINEGKYSKFGDVAFEGNERAEEEFLKEKVRFTSGEEYAASKLDSTQRSIYELGLFYIVSVKSIFENNSDIIPIRIKLEEAPKYNTKFGVGYGRDEKFRFSIEQRILSFFGGARQLKIYVKHSALEPYHLSMDFIQPDFIAEYTNLIISPYLIKQTEPAFELNKKGFDIRLRRPLFENMMGSIKYNYERSNLDTNSISREELEYYDLVSVYNKSGIEVGLERTTSEPIFNPSTGSFSSVVLNLSGLGVNSKYHFLRPTLEYRKYTQATDWLIFAFRFKAGTIFSYDEDKFVPYEERFYSGGSSSLRGWGRAEIGPVDSENQPIGGKSLFESNIEFRYPIYSLISGVIFMDYGNVWSNELTFKVNELRYSAGWGLRVTTPIGPVRLDLAIPIFEGSANLQYMFSVGHAF